MDFLLNPNIAYLFLLAGALLGLLALVTPGTGALEIGALFCLLFAGYAVTQLDFNLWMLILLIVGVVPFVYAIQKPKREWALALSIFCLVVGSAYLFVGERWWFPGVNPIVALTASAVFVGFMWIAVRKSLQAFQAPRAHDLGALVGQVGEAKTRVHEEGSVQVAGELWSARSKNPIGAGKQVRVMGRDGFVLEVETVSEK
jgi:membrane-bound serine protease (ClpP class)